MKSEKTFNMMVQLLDDKLMTFKYSRKLRNPDLEKIFKDDYQYMEDLIFELFEDEYLSTADGKLDVFEFDKEDPKFLFLNFEEIFNDLPYREEFRMVHQWYMLNKVNSDYGYKKSIFFGLLELDGFPIQMNYLVDYQTELNNVLMHEDKMARSMTYQLIKDIEIIINSLPEKYHYAKDYFSLKVQNEIIKELGIPFDLYKDIGRNDKCPCGSGKKYKQCCLNN